jgi:hypothetical protein
MRTKQSIQQKTLLITVGIIAIAIIVSALILSSGTKTGSTTTTITIPEKFQITQDDIQITSVQNQNSAVACNFKPSPYKNWNIYGFVKDSVVPGSYVPEFMWISADVYVDSKSAPYRIRGEVAQLENNQYKFSIPILEDNCNRLSGEDCGILSPESNHMLNICLFIYNSALGITSNQICKQYQVAKLCD